MSTFLVNVSKFFLHLQTWQVKYYFFVGIIYIPIKNTSAMYWYNERYFYHKNGHTHDLITHILNIQFNAHFSCQRGLDSATCLDGLIAFIHLSESSGNEVGNCSLSKSTSRVATLYLEM